MVNQYRKKPVVIEAARTPQDDGLSYSVGGAIARWLDEHGATWSYPLIGGVDITTLEGVMHVTPGDWIIRGVKGEFYPCKPDIFEATYERA
jgi:hypothetical protein